MYKQIKQLADEAIALQNKDAMDNALREISSHCDAVITDTGTASESTIEPGAPVEDTPAAAPSKPAKKGGAK